MKLSGGLDYEAVSFKRTKPELLGHSGAGYLRQTGLCRISNPAAYTHTSVAILDALKAVSLPAVEVHLSDVNSREPFRRISYPGMACERTFSGLGFEGYRQAIQYLKETYGA